MTNFYCGRCETGVDWEVKIADSVVLLEKDAKKVPNAISRAKRLRQIRLRCPKMALTPLIIPEKNFSPHVLFLAKVSPESYTQLSQREECPEQDYVGMKEETFLARCCAP